MLLLLQAAELQQLTNAREAELKYIQEQNDMEVSKSREVSKTEVDKFEKIIAAIGTDTIKAISTAGPDHQVRLHMNIRVN